MFFYRYLLCIGFLALFHFSFSQKNEFGVFGGGSQFYGDLNYSLYSNISNWSIGGLYRYNFNPHISFKNFISYTELKSGDQNHKDVWMSSRNLDFFSEVFEFSQQIEFNFFHYDKNKEKHRFTPYALAGLGVFYFNPKAVWLGTEYELRKLGTEGQVSPAATTIKYNPLQMFFIIGGGLKYSFNKNVSLNIEVALRKTFTDYLDDVGGLYPDEDVILRYDPANGDVVISLSDRSANHSLGIDNRQRSSSKVKDDYLIFGIAFTYTIHKNRPCPPVYN